MYTLNTPDLFLSFFITSYKQWEAEFRLYQTTKNNFCTIARKGLKTKIGGNEALPTGYSPYKLVKLDVS